ncbi:MAG: sporulation protein YqfD [Bacilli bacterium]|nr:sporulation protein YqfD [Bacilli bacterium]
MNSYLYVSVKGNINRFLLKCNKAKINILKIEYISYKSIIILINEKDYNKIKKMILFKTKVINKKGLNKYKDLISKYKILIICSFIGLIILVLLSNIVFSIEIISDNNVLKSKIYKELEYYGISKYNFKKSYSEINKIKKNIKNKFKDNIEWIEIKEAGTKVIVNIVERKVNNIKSDNEIYSVVASKSGIIKNIFVEQGVSIVEKESYVKKGDILITSDIILNDEIKNRVSAKGKVYAETWYKVRVEYPLNYKEIKYTNNTKNRFYIKFGNNTFYLFGFNNSDSKNILNYKNDIGIFEMGFIKLREKKIVNKKYSIKEAKEAALEEAIKKIKTKLNKDEYIIGQNTLKFYNNGSKIVIDVFFSIYEEIGERKVIEMGEEYDTRHIGDGIQ